MDVNRVRSSNLIITFTQLQFETVGIVISIIMILIVKSEMNSHSLS